jgi:hypothetical protein
MHLRNIGTACTDESRPAAAKDQPWTMSCEMITEACTDAPLHGWQLLLRLYSEDQTQGGLRQSADGPTAQFAQEMWTKNP